MNLPVWAVKNVEPREDYSLVIYFADGSKKLYNAKPLLDDEMYEPLKNLPFFMKASALCGTVVWSDDIDIAPEHLYEESLPIYEAENP